MKIHKSAPQVVSIIIARQLCRDANYTIHWRPDQNLDEYDDHGRPQQYAVVYPGGMREEPTE